MNLIDVIKLIMLNSDHQIIIPLFIFCLLFEALVIAYHWGCLHRSHRGMLIFFIIFISFVPNMIFLLKTGLFAAPIIFFSIVFYSLVFGCIQTNNKIKKLEDEVNQYRFAL